MARSADVIVVGAGHNGLVAGNLLADAGWDVVVVEANERVGGAIWSDTSLHPDFVTDWYSAFYPLALASPVLTGLELERFGLSWCHAPTVLAHVFPDGRCAVLSRDMDTTVRSLDSFAVGDGEAWNELVDDFERIKEPLLKAILSPFPPLRAGVRLARTLGLGPMLRFARFAVQPVRRFGDERFRGDGAPMLFAGNALHTDLPPEAAGSAIYGWLLCMLAQTVGFPVPAGGSGAIGEALAARFTGGGGQLRLGAGVTGIEVAGGRTTGVRLASGERLRASTVVADVGVPQLYRDLVGEQHLPSRLVADLANFQWDSPTLKVNWALSRPIPWTAHEAREAGTVHLGVDLNGLTRYAASLATKTLPREPFLLLGQMTTSDPSRSPVGTESAWAYTHVPEGIELSAADVVQHADLLEETIEAQAPGFRASILTRSIQSPRDLQSADANLHNGAVGGGTAGIHQELIFRPVPGLARADTVIDGLYLASAGAHPGGGVHGAPGANAAAAVLARHRRLGRAQRAVIDSAYRHIYR